MKQTIYEVLENAENSDKIIFGLGYCSVSVNKNNIIFNNNEIIADGFIIYENLIDTIHVNGIKKFQNTVKFQF